MFVWVGVGVELVFRFASVAALYLLIDLRRDLRREIRRAERARNVTGPQSPTDRLP